MAMRYPSDFMQGGLGFTLYSDVPWTHDKSMKVMCMDCVTRFFDQKPDKETLTEWTIAFNEELQRKGFSERIGHCEGIFRRELNIGNAADLVGDTPDAIVTTEPADPYDLGV